MLRNLFACAKEQGMRVGFTATSADVYRLGNNRVLRSFLRAARLSFGKTPWIEQC